MRHGNGEVPGKGENINTYRRKLWVGGTLTLIATSFQKATISTLPCALKKHNQISSITVKVWKSFILPIIHKPNQERHILIRKRHALPSRAPEQRPRRRGRPVARGACSSRSGLCSSDDAGARTVVHYGLLFFDFGGTIAVA